jgi:thiamine biosynthesis lipoprotein
VTDDHRGGFTAPGQTISVRQGGLATSSTTARRTADGRGHHVIDPRTGRPAAVSFRTVSVAAASCLDANIAATAAIVRGFAALPWLAQHGLAARLIDAAGLVTYTGGWPEEGDELG